MGIRFSNYQKYFPAVNKNNIHELSFRKVSHQSECASSIFQLFNQNCFFHSEPKHGYGHQNYSMSLISWWFWAYFLQNRLIFSVHKGFCERFFPKVFQSNLASSKSKHFVISPKGFWSKQISPAVNTTQNLISMHPVNLVRETSCSTESWM